ncbi:hypothetical protein PHBOTO_004202 [Pseudozyma hubeiensis]|nr:hypothetical protein PHBOTO_004202 [Pseudozyma hubeiensis]
MIEIEALIGVLGSSPTHTNVQDLLGQLHNFPATVEPDVKAYPDVAYHNYQALGLCLQYEATSPNTNASKCAPQNLRLAAIDVYSGYDDKRWSCFPALPLQVDAVSLGAEEHPRKVVIEHKSTGKHLVADLGEPQRKGGGANDRAGPAVWMEWHFQLESTHSQSKRHFKLQVELAGAAARGADRWNAEKAGACTWQVITIS